MLDVAALGEQFSLGDNTHVARTRPSPFQREAVSHLRRRRLKLLRRIGTSGRPGDWIGFVGRVRVIEPRHRLRERADTRVASGCWIISVQVQPATSVVHIPGEGSGNVDRSLSIDLAAFGVDREQALEAARLRISVGDASRRSLPRGLKHGRLPAKGRLRRSPACGPASPMLAKSGTAQGPHRTPDSRRPGRGGRR